jgi:hypothetical protein
MHQPAECPDSPDEDRPLALRCGCAPAVVAPGTWRTPPPRSLRPNRLPTSSA